MNARTRQTIGWSSLVLAVGLGGVAFWASRAAWQTEQRLLAARAEVERLGAEWRAQQQRTHAEPPEKKSGAAPAAAPANAAAAFPPRTRAPGLSDLARENPQLWNEFIESKRVEMGRFYLPVMQRLNLTEGQRERVRSILTEHLAASTDINTAGTAQGLEFKDPALVKLRAEADARRKSELRALLGAEGLREFEDFERATPMRGAVDGFAVQVAKFAPLSSQQADQLERALAQANAAFRKGEYAVVGELDWAEADRRAREILSPQQWAAWQLGVAHNSFGGARIERELDQAYARAMKRLRSGDEANEAK